MEGIKSSPVILYCSYSSPCGDLLLGATEDRLCLCDWKTRPNQEKIFQRLNRYLNAEWREGNSGILQKASCQLDEYFSGKRETFDIPLLTIGSPFQQEVWKLLQKNSIWFYLILLRTSPTIAETFSNTGRRFSQWSQCAFYFYPLSSGNRTKRSADRICRRSFRKTIFTGTGTTEQNIFHSFRQFIKFRNNQIRVPDKIEKSPPPSVLLFLVSG